MKVCCQNVYQICHRCGNCYEEINLSELDLSKRSVNCLHKVGIRTVLDLVTKTKSEILSYRNFGKKSLNEVIILLQESGLNFGMKFN
ncbi:MAG: hypothetical protein H8E13_17475 [Actinobacteria bacterium]|nr:hypothetical protein [Actinomycetota bacterium]